MYSVNINKQQTTLGKQKENLEGYDEFYNY